MAIVLICVLGMHDTEPVERTSLDSRQVHRAPLDDAGLTAICSGASRSRSKFRRRDPMSCLMPG